MFYELIAKRKDIIAESNGAALSALIFKLCLTECPVGRNYFLVACTIVDLYRVYIIIKTYLQNGIR